MVDAVDIFWVMGYIILLYWLRVSTGWFGSGLCPTHNRPAYIEWPIEQPVDNLRSSQIDLRWTTVGLVSLGIEVNHRIFAELKLKTTIQAQISKKITRSKQKLKQKALYQAQI